MRIQSINFRQDPSPTTTKAQKPEKPEKKESDDTGVIIALGALAALGIAGILIYKNKKVPKKEDIKPPEIPLLTPRTKEEIKAVTEKFSSFIELDSEQTLIDLAEKFDRNSALPLANRRADFLPNSIGIFGSNQPAIDAIVSHLPELTRSKLENIETAQKTLQEITKDLSEKMTAAKEHYQKTGQVTLLHLGNLFKISEKSLKEAPTEAEKTKITDFLKEHKKNNSEIKEYKLVFSAPKMSLLPTDVKADNQKIVPIFVKPIKKPDTVDHINDLGIFDLPYCKLDDIKIDDPKSGYRKRDKLFDTLDSAGDILAWDLLLDIF